MARYFLIVLALLTGCIPTPKTTPKQFKSEVQTVYLTGEVNDDSVAPVIEAIKQGETLVIINSPGGQVFAGLELVRAIKESPRPVVCEVRGMAFSMAAIIFEACSFRIMEVPSVLMFHTVSVNVTQSLPVADLQKLQSEALALTRELELVACSNINLPYKECESKIDATWWLSSLQALQVGATDRIL